MDERVGVAEWRERSSATYLEKRIGENPNLVSIVLIITYLIWKPD